MMAGERDGCEAVLFAYASLLFIMMPPRALGSGEKEYRCLPQVKYECGLERCERMTSDFQHAESFSYNPATGEISACLWTNCYAARAAVLNEGSNAITAIGELEPIAHAGNAPIVVSLTIDRNKTGVNEDNPRFTATWGYRSKGLTLDFGECVLQRGDPAE